MSADRDPVCGMLVEPYAPLVRTYRESTFRFCSLACAEPFDRDPGRFVEDEARIPRWSS